jgi:hypothetical protein
MHSLSILQYNCDKSNGNKTKPLFDQLDWQVHLVAAIQEPGYSEQARTTYYPRGYRLLYEEKAKVCFMISKAVDMADWNWTSYGPNVGALNLRRRHCELTIINVYSEGTPPGPRIRR